MTTDIQLSEAVCDPVKAIENCVYAFEGRNEFIRGRLGVAPGCYYSDQPNHFGNDPQDWGIETFSTDTLMRYPPL